MKGESVCKHNSSYPMFCPLCKIETLESELTRLRSENKIMRETIEFYGDEVNFKFRYLGLGVDGEHHWTESPAIREDKGKRARQALEGLEK